MVRPRLTARRYSRQLVVPRQLRHDWRQRPEMIRAKPGGSDRAIDRFDHLMLSVMILAALVLAHVPGQLVIRSRVSASDEPPSQIFTPDVFMIVCAPFLP